MQGPCWGAVTPSSAHPVCELLTFCPSQHHNAASVPNCTSELLCSSVLPVASDFISCYPQHVLFSTEPLCNEVLQEGLARQPILRSSEEAMANERNTPVPEKTSRGLQFPCYPLHIAWRANFIPLGEEAAAAPPESAVQNSFSNAGHKGASK